MTAKHKLTVRLPQSINNALDQHVKKLGLTKNSYILNLILEKISLPEFEETDKPLKKNANTNMSA